MRLVFRLWDTVCDRERIDHHQLFLAAAEFIPIRAYMTDGRAACFHPNSNSFMTGPSDN